MMAPLWLAWAELWTRRRSFAGNVALVAAAVALVTATEMVSRAREAAVASQMDSMGPSLVVVPAGVTSTQWTRFDLGGRVLSARTPRRTRGEVAHWVRAVEERLLLSAPVGGVPTPIIGVAPGAGLGAVVGIAKLAPDEALVGADLASRLNQNPRKHVQALGRPWRIARTLPRMGTSVDVALITRLAALQRASSAPGSVNEIRLYTRPGAPVAEIAAALEARHPDVSVLLGPNRGDDAERETGATLREHRKVVYGLMGLAVGLSLMIAAYINARERCTEMAMLVAMGGSGGAVLLTLVARAAIVGSLGAVTGLVAGAGIALAQDAASTMNVPWSWLQAPAVILLAAGLCVLAAIPVAAQASHGDHVGALQE